METRHKLGVLAAAGILAAAIIVWRSEFIRPEPSPISGFTAPFVFGRFSVPAENPLTEEAFQLGRHLFYDVRLAGDNSMSCASCHRQELAFTDGLAVPQGIHGDQLPVSSMSLANLLWGPRRFFWNGRALTLEEQALIPISSPVEMDQDIDELVDELKQDRTYRKMFRAAYGDISPDSISKALATFMRVLISQDSKYDRYLRGETKLTAQEELGRKLFMAHPDVTVSLRGGNCIDCHSQFLTSGFKEGLDGFSNNGLDTDAELDVGLFETTGDPAHKGAFKVPTLRNIAVTGPYMHDGRFETLEEVMTHYNSAIRYSETLSPLILEADNMKSDPTRAHGLNLTAEEVDAIVAFLHTLTDQTFLTNPRYSDPFKEKD